jgi:hypothetical protein
MAKIDNNEHRIVQSRTQIWGKAPSSGTDNNNNNNQPIDLISGSVDFNTNDNDNKYAVTGGQRTTENDNTLSTTGDPFHDFFAQTQFSSVGESTNTTTTNQNGTQESEVSEDLIKF